MQSNFLDPILRSNPANSQQVQATSSSERADRVSLRRIRSFDTTNAVVVTGIISRQSPFIHKKEFGCGSQIQEWPVKWLPQSRVQRLLFSCNRNTRGHSA